MSGAIAMEGPLDYDFDTAKRRVHVVYRWQPRFDEWQTTMDIIFHDARLLPGYGIVLDRRELSRAASSDYIRRMVEFIDVKSRQSGLRPWAIVVTDLTSFGAGRMAEQLASDGIIRTFRDFDKALDWLETDPSGEGRPVSQTA